MPLHENYRDQIFVVADRDARLREAGNLLDFRTYASGDDIPPGASVGDFIRIPVDARVRVEEINVMPTGTKKSRIFANVASEDGAIQYGWTSTRNFADKFRNATIGKIEPAHGANRHGATAAWRKGAYIGQVTLIEIIDASLDVERLTEEVSGPYFDMIKAAKADGVTIHINSGFRSYPEQKHLYDGYKRGLPGFNLAARPGTSNHQNGIALDIPVAGGPGNPEYDWLAREATRFGFIRTVKSEYWHWEYRPDEAASARLRGSHKVWD